MIEKLNPKDVINEFENVKIKNPCKKIYLSDLANIFQKISYWLKNWCNLPIEFFMVCEKEFWISLKSLVIWKIWLYKQYKKFILNPFKEYKKEYKDYIKKIKSITDKYKIDKKDNQRIAIYWLLKRWDGLWVTKLLAYLKNVWDPLIKEQKPLPEKEAMEKILERKNQLENFLTEKQLKAYNEFQQLFNKKYIPENNVIHTDTKKNIKNYWPIVIDFEKSRYLLHGIEEIEWKSNYGNDELIYWAWYRVEIEEKNRWLIQLKEFIYRDKTSILWKKETEIIPDLDAINNLLEFWKYIFYYKNVIYYLSYWKLLFETKNYENNVVWTIMNTYLETITDNIYKYLSYKEIDYIQKIGVIYGFLFIISLLLTPIILSIVLIFNWNILSWLLSLIIWIVSLAYTNSEL